MRRLVVVVVAACSTPLRPAPMPPVVGTPAPQRPIDPLDQPAPIDPAIRTGKLANGLTYYILHHAKPEKRAALWLAIDAGSIFEDDDQRGLAHFVEHMAFNGTKRFPKLDIINFIEHAGMKFGPDVNAYTTFDNTVYELTVPTDDRGVMLQGLDVLRDMAGDITFDPVEIDKERGVVLEEWRLQQGVGARFSDQRTPILFAGSRYAQRRPMGLPDIIKTANRDALVRFYKDWYRPDLMAVIAVGDFDPQMLEAEVKTRFGDLAMPAKPREHTAFPVPHDRAPAVIASTDPEARLTSIAIYDKLERRHMVTKRDLRTTLIERLVHTMFTSRLVELRDEPRSPLVSTLSERSKLTRTADAVVRTIGVHEGRLDDGLRLLVRELARLEQHGFLASEFERARKNLLARYDRTIAENKKAPLGELAAEIVRNFVDAELMPGPEVERDWVHELVPAITLDDINAVAEQHAGDSGRVFVITAPANVTVPSEAAILALAADESKQRMPVWKDTTPDEPLLATPPAPGTVVKTEHVPQADATVWTLGNGIRVIVKPTSFANDTVVVDAWKPGGTSLLSDAELVNAQFADEIIPHSGAGKFSERSVRKILAGTSISLAFNLDEREERISGNARPEDLEAMLQLLYLRATQPRHDQPAFDVWKARRLESARHRTDSPDVRFDDEVRRLETGDHPRRRPVTVEAIDKVEFPKLTAAWTARFSDFGDFTFVIVGNVDVDHLQHLVETYLGSLPTKGHKDHWRDIGIKRPTTKIEKTIVAGSEPKSRVHLSFAAPTKYTFEASRDASILRSVLQIRLREVLREDMGGVYDVTVRAGITIEPTQRQFLSISFGCAPDNIDKLRAATFAELASIAKSGVSADLTAKVSEQFRRAHETDLAENDWWAGLLHDWAKYGLDLDKLVAFEPVLARITTANVEATATRLFDPSRYIFVALVPTASGPIVPASPAASPPGSTASGRGSASPRP